MARTVSCSEELLMLLVPTLHVVNERLRIRSAGSKRRVRSQTPIVVTENGVRGNRIVFVRCEQVVEQEPVSIFVIKIVLAERTNVAPVERRTDVAAAIVDQISREQNNVRLILRFPVDFFEAAIEVVEG